MRGRRRALRLAVPALVWLCGIGSSYAPENATDPAAIAAAAAEAAALHNSLLRRAPAGTTLRRRAQEGPEVVIGRTYEAPRRLQASTTDTIESLSITEDTSAAATGLKCMAPDGDDEDELPDLVDCKKADIRFTMRSDKQMTGFMLEVAGTAMYDPPTRDEDVESCVEIAAHNVESCVEAAGLASGGTAVPADAVSCGNVVLGTATSRDECLAVLTAALHDGDDTRACAYTPPSVPQDAAACAQVALGEPSSEFNCGAIRTVADDGEDDAACKYSPAHERFYSSLCFGYEPGTASSPSTSCPPGCIFTHAVDYVPPTTASCTGIADSLPESCTAPTCEFAPDNEDSCTGILGSLDMPPTGCAYTAPSPEVFEACTAVDPDVLESCEETNASNQETCFESAGAVQEDAINCALVGLGTPTSAYDCLSVRTVADDGEDDAACTYVPGASAFDAAACAGVELGTETSMTDCEGIKTAALEPGGADPAACTYTAPVIDTACRGASIGAEAESCIDVGVGSVEEDEAACAAVVLGTHTSAADCAAVRKFHEPDAAACAYSDSSESACNSAGDCDYTAPVPKGATITEECVAPDCSFTTGDGASCTGTETCTEIAAGNTEACTEAAEDSVDADAQACAAVTLGTDPPWVAEHNCEAVRTAADDGTDDAACVYTPPPNTADADACAAIVMGTTTSEIECHDVNAANNIRRQACQWTPPNYGCIYTADSTPTCDLLPTDGQPGGLPSGACPDGCDEVVTTPPVHAVAESCVYPSAGSIPGGPISSTVYTPLRVSVERVTNEDCAEGYEPGDAETPSTTCPAGCRLRRSIPFRAATPDTCEGIAVDQSIVCDLDPATQGTAECASGCVFTPAMEQINYEPERCTPIATVTGHSETGAFVSTEAEPWYLASLFVAEPANLEVDWYCAQGCAEETSEGSEVWEPHEEQCWASSHTSCEAENEIVAGVTAAGNAGRRRMLDAQ